MAGKRGRPRHLEDARWQRAQTAQRMVDEEMAAMQGCGQTPSEGEAKKRVSRRLRVSPTTLNRLLKLLNGSAEPPPRMTWDELQQLQRDDWEVDTLDV